MIAGPASSPETQALLNAAHAPFAPDKVIPLASSPASTSAFRYHAFAHSLLGAFCYARTECACFAMRHTYKQMECAYGKAFLRW